MTAIPRDPPADTPGIRTLGTTATQAAPGNDSRFPGSGTLTVKASYIGTPGATVFYASYDVSGNVIQTRTASGVTESSTVPGLYFYDQVVSLDQFVAVWDENDGLAPATEVIATRHPVKAPSPPTSVTAVGGNTQATVTFTPGDNGGAAVSSYTVTAIDSTNALHGGQVQSGASSPILITGLTNGESYTFTVTATTSFGTSAASAASNAVVPAVVLTAPGPPTGVTATPGNGQAVVSFTAPANNGGSAITSYTVTAVDETTPANGGQTHVGNSPNTIAGLVNADVYHFTVTATNAIGTSVASVASNSVTPTGAGGGLATFTYTQPSSSTLLLDATGSTGTLVWNIDGVNAAAATTTLTVGPLKVGTHTVKLTATSGAASVSTRNIDVAWVGRPLGDAQHDSVNGSGISAPNQGWWGPIDKEFSTTLLPQWPSLPAIGPWRNKQILNTGGSAPNGDGVSRITVVSNNEIALLTKYGDHPGSTGGYRSAMEMNTSYDATLAGYEFGYSGDIDVGGNIVGAGTTGSVRFHRVDIKFPTTNPGGSAAPTGYQNGVWLYQNNAYEIHGNAGGSSPVRFQMSGDGKQFMWAFESITNGVSSGQKNFDIANTLYGTWYQYIVELLLSKNAAVGYVRFWRDTGSGYTPIVTSVPTGTILTGADAGKYFAVTQQTNTTGQNVNMATDCQNYRTRATMPSNYPDVSISYRNVISGPTMASVLI